VGVLLAVVRVARPAARDGDEGERSRGTGGQAMSVSALPVKPPAGDAVTV
jgi:hypothetical protein